MTFFLILLLLLPSTIYADCGNCDEDWEQRECERKRDKECHACRSCLKPIQMSQSACPDKDYECYEGWPITPKVLTPNEGCRCAEAKCAGNARLAVDGEIVTSKLRCNNSQWTVDGEVAENVICARLCSKRVCKTRHPMNLPDFAPMQFPDTTEGCAVGKCDPKMGMVALKDNGVIDAVLEEEVTCSADGKWKEGEGKKWKFVMCNASPCGPTKCPKQKEGLGMDSGEVQALIITGKGKSCATASCPPYTAFAEVDKDGKVGVSLAHVSGFSCTEDGAWRTSDDSKDYPFVMCQQPPCPGRCNGDPLETKALTDNGDLTTLFPARRDGCDYSCPDDKSMFYDGGDMILAIPSATCGANNEFMVEPLTLTVPQIGCWECDIKDMEPLDSTKEWPRVDKCVASCNKGYDIEYSFDDPESPYRTPWLTRSLEKKDENIIGRWWDSQNDGNPVVNAKFSCHPSGTAECKKFISNMARCVTCLQEFEGQQFECKEPEVANTTHIVCPDNFKTIVLSEPDGYCDYVKEMKCDNYGQWRRTSKFGNVMMRTHNVEVSCTNKPPNPF